MDKNKLKELQKLKVNKYRKDTYLVETEHLVEEAKKYAKVLEVFSTDLNTKDTYLSETEMMKISTVESRITQMALVQKEEKNIESTHILGLCDIQDPGNVGGLIRSAAGFNFKKIFLSKACADIYNSKTLRASQGAIFQLDLQVTDIFQTIKEYKNKGFLIVGSALEGGKPLKSLKINNEKIFLLLGNEGQGIPKEILTLCDLIIFIEMENIESLNVLAAGSILLYHFKKD